MDKIDLYNAKMAEMMNSELIHLENNSDLICGRRIRHLKEAFPKSFIPFIKKYHKYNSIQKKVAKVSTALSQRDVYYADPEPNGYKGVVYTCITGGYDTPYEPLFLDRNLHYELFSDIAPLNDSVWHFNQVHNDSKEASNFLNRYYKLHPFEFFENEDFAMYIDGNVQLASNVSSLFAVAHHSSLGIAMHRHAKQNCLYKNALVCEYNNRGNIEEIRNQVSRYRAEGFPENYGLLEATIIVVDLHNQYAKYLLDQWWEEFIKSKSGRDQLSLPYILWKNGHTIDEVGNLGNDEYQNPKFHIHLHKGKLF